MNPNALAIAISLAASSLPALAADVYKCQNAVGKVEFRDRPCDAAHTTQKLDVKPNSAGTMTLDEVRAKAAALKAKQQVRQDMENKANADAYAAQERQWQQERAHQDAVDMQQAIRDSGAAAGQAQYNSGYSAGQRDPQKIKVEIAVKPTPGSSAKPPVK